MIVTIISRCQDINARKEYVELVESVRDYGGDIKIFSSLHVSGERKLLLLVESYKLFRFWYF